MKVFQVLFFAALVCGVFAHGRAEGGTLVLDACAVEDPTYLEFFIEEDNTAHIQHETLEPYGINLIDIAPCGGEPTITLNRSPVPGQSIIEAPGAIRYNPTACGGTQDIEAFVGGTWVSLTNLICDGQLRSVSKKVSSDDSSDEVTLEDGSVVSIDGVMSVLYVDEDKESIASTVSIASAAHLGDASVESSKVHLENGLPVITMKLDNGSSFQFACSNASCDAASVSAMNVSVISEACTLENTGTYVQHEGTLHACSALPKVAGTTNLFMWVPLGNNLESHL